MCCFGVNMFSLWLPYAFLMFSLWFPYVSFDFRVLPKIITRCEGAFGLLWCNYVFLMVSFCFPYGFLMDSSCFLDGFLMVLLVFFFMCFSWWSFAMPGYDARTFDEVVFF